MPASSIFHLFAVDVRHGLLVQDVPLGEAGRCGIEDVDDLHLLVSRNGRDLICFRRER